MAAHILGKEGFDLIVFKDENVPKRGMASGYKLQLILLDTSDLQGMEDLSTPSELEEEGFRGLIELYIENTRPLADWKIIVHGMAFDAMFM